MTERPLTKLEIYDLDGLHTYTLATTNTTDSSNTTTSTAGSKTALCQIVSQYVIKNATTGLYNCTCATASTVEAAAVNIVYGIFPFQYSISSDSISTPDSISVKFSNSISVTFEPDTSTSSYTKQTAQKYAYSLIDSITLQNYVIYITFKEKPPVDFWIKITQN